MNDTPSLKTKKQKQNKRWIYSIGICTLSARGENAPVNQSNVSLFSSKL